MFMSANVQLYLSFIFKCRRGHRDFESSCSWSKDGAYKIDHNRIFIEASAQSATKAMVLWLPIMILNLRILSDERYNETENRRARQQQR